MRSTGNLVLALNMNIKLNIKNISIVSISLFFIGFLLTSFATQQVEESNIAPLQTVQIITAKTQPLIISNELPGRIEPTRIAEVRARVEGIILKRMFEEGALVKQGQVLFEIDPTLLQYTLSRAEAELAKNSATLEELTMRVNRYQTLLKTKAVSQQDYDTILASFKNTQASYQSALAEVNIAKLNLEHATVTAPISGRIGRSLVSEGALVGNGDATALAVIQQIDPIYVDFKQPINEVLVLQEKLTHANGRFTQEQSQALPLTVTLDGSSKQYHGHLLFSDISVERSTGQVLLRGELNNGEAMLLPGMYVRVNLEQSIDNQAILIPQRAVKIGSDGKTAVLIVNQDNVVESKFVTTGKMYGQNWYIVAGLKNGDNVIVNGNAQPGESVIAAVFLNENTQNHNLTSIN